MRCDGSGGEAHAKRLRGKLAHHRCRVTSVGARSWGTPGSSRSAGVGSKERRFNCWPKSSSIFQQQGSSSVGMGSKHGGEGVCVGPHGSSGHLAEGRAGQRTRLGGALRSSELQRYGAGPGRRAGPGRWAGPRCGRGPTAERGRGGGATGPSERPRGRWRRRQPRRGWAPLSPHEDAQDTSAVGAGRHSSGSCAAECG